MKISLIPLGVVFILLFFPVGKVYAFDPGVFQNILGMRLEKNSYDYKYIQKRLGPAQEMRIGDAVSDRDEICYTNEDQSEVLCFDKPECEDGYELMEISRFEKTHPKELKARILDSQGQHFGKASDLKPTKLKAKTFDLLGVHLGMTRQDVEKLFTIGKTEGGFSGKLKKGSNVDNFDYKKRVKDTEDDSYFDETLSFSFKFNQNDQLTDFELSEMVCQ